MSLQPMVLIVDDEEDICLLLQMSLKKMGLQSEFVHTVTQAKKKLARQNYQVCLTDFKLPDGTGLELVEYCASHCPQMPIAVLTAYGNMEIAISALKAGAFDFVNKPIQHKQLEQLLQKALNHSQHLMFSQQNSLESKMLIGDSQPIQQLKSSLKKIARSQAPVFIIGESGTGKEVVANLVHRLSHRSEGAFISVNCSAIPPELMESELFGHKKGSFAGATQDKQGLIVSAHGGSLFLDEVAELPLVIQVKLLQVIQDKKVRPIGATQDIDVDFRLISSSQQDLDALVQQGKFRQDLYFRIVVMDLHLPPLRERGQDVIILAEHFLQKICQEWGIAVKQLSPDVKHFLLNQYFSGNVRELRNIIERAITLCDTATIQLEHVQFGNVRPLTPSPQEDKAEVFAELEENRPTLETKRGLPKEGLEKYLEQVEKEMILTALDLTHWNRTLAAKKLGMSFRSLRYRLKKFGLDEIDEFEDE